jgi:hypothetical protein
MAFPIERDCCHKSHEINDSGGKTAGLSLSAVRPFKKEELQSISGFVLLPTDSTKPEHITRSKWGFE